MNAGFGGETSGANPVYPLSPPLGVSGPVYFAVLLRFSTGFTGLNRFSKPCLLQNLLKFRTFSYWTESTPEIGETRPEYQDRYLYTTKYDAVKKHLRRCFLAY
jgi:hypothetical protein